MGQILQDEDVIVEHNVWVYEIIKKKCLIISTTLGDVYSCILDENKIGYRRLNPFEID